MAARSDRRRSRTSRSPSVATRSYCDTRSSGSAARWSSWRSMRWSDWASICRGDPCLSAGRAARQRTCLRGRILRLQAALQISFVVLLEVFDAVGGDCQAGVVGPLHVALLNEIPDRELEVLARPAEHAFEIQDEQAVIAGLGAAPRIQDFEDGEPRDLFELEVAVGAR